MPTTPPTITALPTPPDPNDRSTFNARAYPWSVAQQTLAVEANAVAANVYANATEAAAQAELATTSGAAAVGAANYKGPWSSLTGALAIPASVSHADGIWVLASSVADVTAHTPGVSAQWISATGSTAGPKLIASTTISSAVAQVDFLNSFSDDYDDYEIVISGVVTSATTGLTLKFATSGTVDAGSNIAVHSVCPNGASVIPGSPDAYSSLFLTYGGNHTTGYQFHAQIQLRDFRSTARKGIFAQATWARSDDSNRPSMVVHAGRYIAASKASGIRFLPGSGNLTAGRIEVWGIRK